MRRLLTALVAALAFPSAAAAKELQSLAVCGQGGTCHPVRDHRSLTAYERGLSEATAPERGGPFLRVRLTIGGHEMPRPVVDIGRWLPAAGLMRTEGDDGIFWIGIGEQSAAVLRRAARGLQPFAAAKLGPIAGSPHAAKVDEVVLPPTKNDGGGGGGPTWALSLLAVFPAGLVFAMRRRGRWN